MPKKHYYILPEKLFMICRFFFTKQYKEIIQSPDTWYINVVCFRFNP
jgi:hypothetical protein